MTSEIGVRMSLVGEVCFTLHSCGPFTPAFQAAHDSRKLSLSAKLPGCSWSGWRKWERQNSLEVVLTKFHVDVRLVDPLFSGNCMDSTVACYRMKAIFFGQAIGINYKVRSYSQKSEELFTLSESEQFLLVVY